MFSLVVGFIARALVPGRQSIGIALTIGLGVAGAMIGGLISTAIWPTWANDPDVSQMWPGWLMSVAGAVISGRPDVWSVSETTTCSPA